MERSMTEELTDTLEDTGVPPAEPSAAQPVDWFMTASAVPKGVEDRAAAMSAMVAEHMW
jgi:hypothetical protein